MDFHKGSDDRRNLSEVLGKHPEVFFVHTSGKEEVCTKLCINFDVDAIYGSGIASKIDCVNKFLFNLVMQVSAICWC